ncbi:MAG TPA: NADH-quinone oxidoreductase subunit C [Dongiaceae bacterium]|nr:NADH-quinone oxidoreductase subunit C [Dongiaceae bacterium]
MSGLLDVIRSGSAIGDPRPWPRFAVDADGWIGIGQDIADGRGKLVSLWGEAGAVHMAVMVAEDPGIAIFSLDCPERRFPSLGSLHAPAIRLERSIADLYGLQAEGASDTRHWLDHGRWGVGHPLGSGGKAAPGESTYAFLQAEGPSLHQIPVGPVHAGIIEPGHFRFTANGETVVRLEERLGYVHKGVDGLMTGTTPDRGARLAGRVSGDSAVAYAFAFANAVEAALGAEISPRAKHLRAVMAELERIANHLGDIGAICNDASFGLLQAHFAVLREGVLRTASSCFGHRLMRDRILPGGVAADLDGRGIAELRDLIDAIEARFAPLVEIYDETASLQDRTVGTGILRPALARKFGAGGYVGRASGHEADARKTPGYTPYDALRFETPILEAGDVNARVWIRIREVEQSLSLLRQILEGLPTGDVMTELRASGTVREGVALVEGFRGDIFVWLRIGSDGRIERCHLRDPSWFQWPLLEAVIEGNIVADFPLCNKSFNCSYSGHDL